MAYTNNQIENLMIYA